MASSFRVNPAARAVLATAGRNGLRLAAERLLAESRSRVPVDTGALRDSAGVAVGDDSAAVFYRDPAAPAAHENLRVRYRNGREAKFLEGPLNRLRPELAAIIAADVRRDLS